MHILSTSKLSMSTCVYVIYEGEELLSDGTIGAATGGGEGVTAADNFDCVSLMTSAK